MGGRAGGNRPLLARKQLSGDAAHGRRSASCRTCPGARPRSKSCAARPMATTSTPSRPPSPGSPRPGTLALVSGPDNPTTLNFLPDNHIVVLPREAIEADYESVFAKLRERLRQGRRAAHAQFHHRPVAVGRYRADAAAWRARAPTAAYRRRRLNSCDLPPAQRAPRINGMLIAASVLPQRENFYSQLQQTP